jgi:amino acid adenylation domain-containing protein
VRADWSTDSSDRCYVLFTSGTTGKPNGVAVTHRNVCNLLLTQPGDLGIQPGWRVAQILNIAFDMAAWEILGCLSHGATLVIRHQDITEAVSDVDVVIATPSVLASVDSRRCARVRVVAVAGEPCPRPLADHWARFCTFYNGCGPTETTIVNTMQRHTPDATMLTIGRPTPNNTVYVLDADGRPCAIGETGEMWAGGDGVSSGYLGNPELNAERYRPDPFLPGRMMFRTRDLGRWTIDGELEHLGRTDDQVKIRGFRVELDSVSAVVESVVGCTRAVTLKLDDRSLICFVCPATVDTEAVRTAVAAALPYYCVPSVIQAIDIMPETSRGKVDKAALLRGASGCAPTVREVRAS